MSSLIDSLRSLAPVMAGALPCPSDLGGLSAADSLEAARLLGGMRSQLDESIALLAADIEHRSARELGTEGLAAKNGFKDAAGLVQDLVGVRRDDAARLIRVGGLLETAEAVAPASVEASAIEPAVPLERSLDMLRDLPGSWDAPVAVALKHGWLSAAQADALRTGLGNPRTEQFRPAWRQAVLELIGDCWSGQWNPEDLSRAAKRHRSSLDGAAAAAEAKRRYELRSFKRVLRASGMVHYDIDLDPESDARFYGPMKRLLSPRFGGPRFTTEPEIAAARELEADPRTNEQLQADTLLDLIDRAVSTDNGELFKTHEPQVMVAVTTMELRKARDAQHALHRHLSGDHTACPARTGFGETVADDAAGGADTADAMDASAAASSTGMSAELADRPTPGAMQAGQPSASRSGRAGAAFGVANADCPGPDCGIAWVDGRDEPISAADALRMMCDRGFTPALFDETGRAIDVGKDQRYFTRRQRRAITKRDGSCLYPGCDRPPEDCEYHHINPWAQHPGNHKSEVRDGVLLCRRHHKMLHDFAARIERRRSEYWLHWPGKEPVCLHTKAGVQTQLRAAAGHDRGTPAAGPAGVRP